MGEPGTAVVVPAHPVPPSVSLAWQAPEGSGLFLELTEGFQIT